MIAALVTFIGRHATSLLAGGVLVGLAVPPLAKLLQPLLLPTFIIPLMLSIARTDFVAIAAWRHRPGVMLLAMVWLMLGCPLIVWAVVGALAPLGLPASIGQALIISAACSPLMASAALALIVGFDASLAMAVSLVCTALVPLTLPPLASALTGIVLDIHMPAFAMRLALIVGGAFLGAALLRHLATPARLAARRPLIDAVIVSGLAIFGIAIMDGVTALVLERPGFAFTVLVAAFVVNIALQVAGATLTRWLGGPASGSFALMSGNRNMALVLVALAGSASFEVLVFFALAQVPMYTLPALLDPWYRRLRAEVAGRPAPPS